MQTPKQENVVPLSLPLRRLAPASLSPGAAPGLVPFPRWQKACDRVSAALLGGEARVVVTGPPGTGKTLLLDHIARVLRASGWTVMLRLADASPPPNQRGSVALLIDEADRLSREALRDLLATVTGPIVLAGLDVLQTRVPGATQVALSPLGREEARDYIAHWLALTGRAPENLEAAAMRRTVEISGGVPRLASTLLSAAAWLAESSDQPIIKVEHVEEAAALRSCFVSGDVETGEEAAERTNTPLLMALAAAMLLLGAGAYVATRYYPAETERALDRVHEAATQLQSVISDKLNGPPPIKVTDAPPSQAKEIAPTPPTRVAEAPPAAPIAVAPPKPAPEPVAARAEPPPAPPPPEPVVSRALEPPAPKPVLPEPVVAQPQPPAAPPAEPPPSLQSATTAQTDQPAPAPSQVTTSAAPPEIPPPAPVAANPPSTPVAATPVAAPPIVAAPVAPAPVAAAPAAPAPIATAPAAPPPAAASPVAAPPPKPAPTVVASAAPLEPDRSLAPETIALLMRRGAEMMAIGDVSAARLLFGRAAEAGSAVAMVEMGRTYDPAVLAQSSPLLQPDVAEAAKWYRRAGKAGSKAADDLLARVERPRPN